MTSQEASSLDERDRDAGFVARLQSAAVRCEEHAVVTRQLFHCLCSSLLPILA